MMDVSQIIQAISGKSGIDASSYLAQNVFLISLLLLWFLPNFLLILFGVSLKKPSNYYKLIIFPILLSTIVFFLVLSGWLINLTALE